MARVGHAGRGERPDLSAGLLAQLVARDGPACLVVRLAAAEVERALGGILIDCLSKRVRLAVEVPDGDPTQVVNSIVALAARLGKRRPRVGLLQARDILATQEGARLLAVPCDPPPPNSTLVSARAPLGAEPLLGLFSKGAEVVVSGLLSPSAVAVAFARHEHRWQARDHDRIAAAAAVGRILSAGAAAAGGDLDDAPDNVGLPFADIAADGVATFGSTGAAPRVPGLALSLVDGVRDPQALVEPDVTVDLEDATLLGSVLTGVRGRAPADWLAGTLAFEIGFVAEAEIGYGGTGAAARAIAAARELEARLAKSMRDDRFRVEIVGIDASTKAAGERAANLAIVPARDVRLRMAVRTAARAAADGAVAEFAAVASFGPAGAGGFRAAVAPERRLCEARIPKALVPWSATPPAGDP
ncbi:MAG: acyclic terpene utilization AtuA family protein [Rhodospirillales bacterium]|nr:acyclic terpene utilization AtuA family protein [Rhodospirillales bacterium]